MENPFNTEQNNAPKRSTLLTVLLILTFIWSGIHFLSNAYISLALEQVIGIVEDAKYEDSMAAFAATLEQSIRVMEQTGAWGFGLSAILYLFSLIGAFLMWKLNRRGFHFYASAQIAILLAPMILGMANFPGILPTLITALFIWLYARELKIFAKPSKAEA